MNYIINPVLKGFNPDPSILRVGEDYYIATSTFEWFPGVQIHHSKDLINWELIAHPLDRLEQLNMLGEDNSCGVWAPCLSYDNGTYYLVYTDVKSFRGMFMDTHNYLVTSKDIGGPWSDPIYLNSSGFDPSLFHDRDGRKYLLNMLMDYRSYRSTFGGIVLQEYSEEKACLIGEPEVVFKGSPLGGVEGPHLYYKDGFYYLLTAEGETEYRHAATVARSKNIGGPYELAPNTPLLTSYHVPLNILQKAGHASFVETEAGNWYMAHLCSRPVGDTKRCILGRETGIQKLVWKDGWPYLEDGRNVPSEKVPAEENVKYLHQKEDAFYEEFEAEKWSIHLQSLRVPLENRATLLERAGYLRLYGAESLNSKFKQSLLAHRQQRFRCIALTKVDFHPSSFKQMAGLVYYYNTECYYYLYISREEALGRVITIMKCDLGQGSHPIGSGVPIPDDGEIYLKLQTSGDEAQFSYSLDGEEYYELGNALDATILSDDYYKNSGHVMFTGAFIGICCQDLAGKREYADFDFLHITEY